MIGASPGPVSEARDDDVVIGVMPSCSNAPGGAIGGGANSPAGGAIGPLAGVFGVVKPPPPGLARTERPVVGDALFGDAPATIGATGLRTEPDPVVEGTIGAAGVRGDSEVAGTEAAGAEGPKRDESVDAGTSGGTGVRGDSGDVDGVPGDDPGGGVGRGGAGAGGADNDGGGDATGGGGGGAMRGASDAGALNHCAGPIISGGPSECGIFAGSGEGGPGGGGIGGTVDTRRGGGIDFTGTPANDSA